MRFPLFTRRNLRAPDGHSAESRTLIATVLFSALVLGPPATGQEVTANQFLRLIKAAHAPIRDVSFAFEGDNEYLGPSAEDQEDHPQRYDIRFEGRYAFRALDGATFLEMFYDLPDNSPGRHSIMTSLKGMSEIINITPDVGSWNTLPIYRSPGGPSSMHVQYSPAFYVFLWLFQPIETASDFGYSFLGWEDIDGHRCLKIEFDSHPGYGGRAPTQNFWLDMERGAHILRHLRTLDGSPIEDTKNIQLAQFPLPSGEQVWFPVRCEILKYGLEGEYHDEPTFREVNYIVNGTLKFNTNLPDSRFLVDKLMVETSLRNKPRRWTPTTEPRVNLDPEQRLDEQLADAKIQARILDASASAEAEGFWASTIPYVLAGLGGLVLVGILVWRIRTR